MLNKKVVNVTTSNEGASVDTEDGETYKGDIVIGADGVHSFVRRQMRQIAAKQSPGHFLEDEESSQFAKTAPNSRALSLISEQRFPDTISASSEFLVP